MRVSIKDIAKAAGVSHSTVSRALADSPLIAARTRARIHRIAQKRGYAPNAIARSLVTRQTRAIGVVVTSIADPFIADVVRGIERVALEQGYRVFLGTSHDVPSREVSLVKALREWNVDGVIVASSRMGGQYQPLLEALGAPIVLINHQSATGGHSIHSVAVDDVLGGELATQHLIERGHRAIAYLGGPADRLSNRERFKGYRRALAQAKIPFNAALTLPGNGHIESGEPVTQLLDLKPTAIFCYNDMTALGTLHALRKCGMTVPRDVSLVGYDDIALAAYTNPPLTTVRQPKDELGSQAMHMLLNLLNDAPVVNVKLSVELVVRESTRQI